MVFGPYRLASPPEPPRTEEADSYELTLVAERKRERRTKALIGLLGLTLLSLAVTAYARPRSSPGGAELARRRLAERTERARTTIDTADRSATAEEKRFQIEVRAAVEGRLAPSLPLTACNVSLPEPDRLVRGPAPFPLLVVREHEQGVLHSAALARVWRDISHARELLVGENPVRAVVYADALEAKPVDARLTQEVILVHTKLRRPARSSPTTYEPGVVDGIAYVYDFHEHKVMCAGEIHATNTRALEYSFNDRADAPTWQDKDLRLDATLEDDFDAQVARAITAPNALYSLR